MSKPKNTGGWISVIPAKCDNCNRRAIWCHPAGGLRCGRCPRPRETAAQRKLREAAEAAWIARVASQRIR